MGIIGPESCTHFVIGHMQGFVSFNFITLSGLFIYFPELIKIIFGVCFNIYLPKRFDIRTDINVILCSTVSL